MQISIRIFIVILTLFVLVVRARFLTESGHYGPFWSKGSGYSIIGNDDCLYEKDVKGTSLDEFIKRSLRGYITMRGNGEGSFQLEDRSYTIIHLDNNYRYDETYIESPCKGSKVIHNFVIRPVKIVARRDRNEEVNSVDGTDLIVHVNIFAEEHKVWIEGDTDHDNNKWEKGHPEFPDFVIKRKNGDQFTWHELPRSELRKPRVAERYKL